MWRNFKKKKVNGAAPEDPFVVPNGIIVADTLMVGSRRPTPAVSLSQAPLLIATVLGTKALAVLREADLKFCEALVARGLSEEAANVAIELAVRLAEPALPGDVELVRRITGLFGAQADGGVRTARA